MLRGELLNGEIFYTLHEAKVLIEMWRWHYNQVRPHSALGYRPPAPEAVPGPPHNCIQTLDVATKSGGKKRGSGLQKSNASGT
jgi:hypothetical protein